MRPTTPPSASPPPDSATPAAPPSEGAGPPPAPRAPTRREFAAVLALTTLGACVHRSAGGAGATGAATPATPSPAPPAPPTPPAPAAADALLGAVVARYGDALPAADRPAVRAELARGLQLADRLRRAPVANGVDPFSSFCPAPPGAVPAAADGAAATPGTRRAP